MGIRIVPITKDSDAKRRKRTTSKIKGTPSEKDADRRAIANKKLKEMMGEGSKNISAMDKARVEEITEEYEKYMKRNDGGMAMSGRGKPVRTF